MAEQKKPQRQHISLAADGDPPKEELLRDVVVPKKFFRRLSTGVPVLDEIFGGQEMPGIFPGGTYMFTGGPGTGKSTMGLQLADLLQLNAGRCVLYNLGEENKYSIKIRADRLNIKGEFAISLIEDVNKLLEHCKSNGVEVLFQDSLQSLRDGDLHGGELLKSVTKKLHRYCKDNDVTLFLVGHVTKGGRFAGPQEIVHDVDGHIHMKLNPETGNRIFQLEKNRWGPATIPYEFMLSATGMDFQQVSIADTENEPGAGVSKAAERRDQIKTLIKEKLLEGEKISGYCFERFDVDCSGGFWRGMLAKAVKELKNDGHDVGEMKDGPSGKNRAHNFIRKPEEK